MPNRTIAIASGKGGTGKTTVAVNLAAASPNPVTLLDCDVEEPNAHLFLRPEWMGQAKVSVLNPVVNNERCDGCGMCKDHCRFNAIAVLAGKPLIFPELCHSCGACVRACPHNALEEILRPIGVAERGQSQHIELVHGRLNVGEAKSPPLIEDVRKRAAGRDLVIIDAPPGTSCPVMAAIGDVDYLVLVTEPTPFGLADLKLAYEMATALSLDVGVVINKSDIGDSGVREFCEEAGIPILQELPFDPEVAKAYSRGEVASLVFPAYRSRFTALLSRIEEAMNQT